MYLFGNVFPILSQEAAFNHRLAVDNLLKFNFFCGVKQNGYIVPENSHKESDDDDWQEDPNTDIWIE